MKIYNTLSKKKEELRPCKEGLVKIYNCGPTVYNNPHLGNLRTYIYVDILRKTLLKQGFKVKEVMNITDIEDKIIRDSLKQNIFYKDLTKKYEKVLWRNLEDLNIDKPEFVPHATDQLVINRMIKIIEKLLYDDYAYKSEDGSVYFSIKSFKKYGKLSGLKKRELKVGARVSQDEYDKENAQDFVLWKAAKPGEPSWPTPFGIGRPGWHIECTAMSTMLLGSTIDIHAGGVDLVFPHHENEIAQSEAFTGVQFVKYWFHPEHLLIEGRRMGKSEGNAYTLDEIVKKYKVEPLSFRYLALTSHYRDRLNFTEKSIKDAQITLNNIRKFLNRINQRIPNKSENGLVDSANLANKNFILALNDDLGMPKAIAVIFNFISDVNKKEGINKSEKDAILDLFCEIDKVLDLNLAPDNIDTKTMKEFKNYQTARENEDWKNSDKLRKALEKKGWIVEDSKTGSILIKK